MWVCMCVCVCVCACVYVKKKQHLYQIGLGSPLYPGHFDIASENILKSPKHCLSTKVPVLINPNTLRMH